MNVNGRYPYRKNACVPFAIAEALERPELAHSLPCGDTPGWEARLDEHLIAQADHTLIRIPDSELPYEDPEREWLAGVSALDCTPHCVLALRRFCTFDANDELQPGDPLPEVDSGWLILPYPAAIRQHQMERVGEVIRKRELTVGGDT